MELLQCSLDGRLPEDEAVALILSLRQQIMDRQNSWPVWVSAEHQGRRQGKYWLDYTADPLHANNFLKRVRRQLFLQVRKKLPSARFPSPDLFLPERNGNLSRSRDLVHRTRCPLGRQQQALSEGTLPYLDLGDNDSIKNRASALLKLCVCRCTSSEAQAELP